MSALTLRRDRADLGRNPTCIEVIAGPIVLETLGSPVSWPGVLLFGIACYIISIAEIVLNSEWLEQVI